MPPRARSVVPLDPRAETSTETAVLDLSSGVVLLMGLVGCFLTALGVVGCGGTGVRAELFEIDAVGPEAVEAGRPVVIEGHGLPYGSEGTLLLEGTLSQVGGTRSVSLELPAEIVSTELAEARVTGAFLDGLGGGGRGTFRGRAELSVHMAEGEGAVSGSLEGVVLDFVPTAAWDDEEDALSGPSIAEVLGLVIALGPEGEGLVAEVSAEGAASRMGMAPGDRLVAIEGMRILRPADLLGWTDARELVVQRGERTSTLHAPTTADVSATDRSRGLQLAALFLVLLVLVRERDRPLLQMHGKARAWGSELRVVLGKLPVAALGLSLLSLVLFHQLMVHLAVDRLQMLLAPALGLLIVAGSVVAPSPWAVLSSFGRALSLLLVVGLAVLSTAAHGSADLGPLEDAQSLSPLTWALFASPVAPALLVLVAWAMPEPEVPGRPVALLVLLVELSVTVLAVVCLAGGRGDASAWGAVVFALRGLLLLLVLRAARQALRASRRASQVALVVGSIALTVGMGAFLVFGAPSQELSLAVGRASAELWLVSVVLAALLFFRPRPQPLLDAELAL